jgi:cystathionine gamma-synthase
MKENDRSIVRRSALPPSISRPLVTPIMPSAVYVAPDLDAIDAQYKGREPGFTYAREGHPNAAVLADKIDWLEGAAGGVITSSGMAAISAVFLGLLKAGDHVVGSNQLYGRTLRQLTRELPKFGITATLVDPSDAAAVEAAVTLHTRMIVVEVVSNPTIVLADMTGIARVAKDKGVWLAVDNTFTTPLAFRPFAHGADIVIHSVTKLMAGHSDVTLGYAVARAPELNRQIYDAMATYGLNASPFDCWLAERGLHSFELRFERASANAMALAEYLQTFDAVETVHYPGLPGDPGHGRASGLLGGRFGNMLSFRLKGGWDAANAFVRAVPELPFAPTLGDVATTVSHPPTSSHRAMSREAREVMGITDGFIRVSVGIEDAGLIKRSFASGLKAAAAHV